MKIKWAYSERAMKGATSSKISSDDRQSKVRRTSMTGHVCFLCEKENPTSELRQAMTMQLDKRLNECARNLNNGKLLALLSGGNVFAQELKYHYSCLTALYHKERAYLLTIENQDQDDSELSQEMETYLRVFSELLIYIVETKTSSENPVVFRLADLVSLHKQRLEQLGMKTPDFNFTRLKEKLLAEIPELEIFKKDIGTALSQASIYSEAIILVKAAKILQGQMIDHESHLLEHFMKDMLNMQFLQRFFSLCA